MLHLLSTGRLAAGVRPRCKILCRQEHSLPHSQFLDLALAGSTSAPSLAALFTMSLLCTEYNRENVRSTAHPHRGCRPPPQDAAKPKLANHLK
ncbi:hypothetical protein BDU57DRAFT_109502 [Ampelomyces quisqualis]|uniref:Uncharacterized protein n=1 Tax=Ampelomyces quisqualis TaxID=50730 RepID=A0A6A5Q8M2_AMPQU|nr:hypothetical protein BDU57DRAFT_109502 [Ampelomyces quisqualis]